MSRPVPRCPLRPGEPCSLCQLYVTGPQDCGLVYLVMGDEELRVELARSRQCRDGGKPGVGRCGDGKGPCDGLGPDPRLEGLD